MTRAWAKTAVRFSGALATIGVALWLVFGAPACGGGPCDDLEAQLLACPTYHPPPQTTPTACPPCTPSPGIVCVCNPAAPVPIPLDCSGSTVNNLAQCILDSRQDLCSPDGLAIANAQCNK